MLSEIEDQPIKKTFINSFNKATFVCPECERSKTINVSKYKETKKAVKVNCMCSCGHSYTVLLERRQHFRKKVSLSGIFTQNKNKKGFITVNDLSRSGLKFELFEDEYFQIGDRLWIEFTLDDPSQSLIKREVIIKNIRGLYIGAEFESPEHLDKLGPYLLYNFN